MDAAQIEKDAAKAAAKEVKPLPMLVSPMTRLSQEIREKVAIFCKEKNASFSTLTNQMWIDRLKTLGKIAKDFVPVPVRAAASGLRVKLDASEAEIAELEKMLNDLKAAKK